MEALRQTRIDARWDRDLSYIDVFSLTDENGKRFEKVPHIPDSLCM